MKFAVLGDLHFGARNNDKRIEESIHQFFLEVFIPYCIKHKIKQTIQLGDFFDVRKSADISMLYFLKTKIVPLFKESGMTFHILIGNHDTYYKNTNEINSLELILSDFDFLKVYYKPTTISVGKMNIDLIPWINEENEEEVVKFISKSKSTYCAGHFDLSGFMMNKQVVSQYHSRETGFLDQYHSVWSGHFHTRSSNGHVTYTGTPYELTWADFKDQKGFHIVDDKDGELVFVPNPNTLHEKVFYDDSKTDKEMEISPKRLKNKKVRVVVTRREDHIRFDLLLDKLNKMAYEVTVIDEVLLNEEENEDYEVMDILTTTKKHIEALENVNEKDKKEIERMMAALHQEAVSIGGSF